MIGRKSNLYVKESIFSVLRNGNVLENGGSVRLSIGDLGKVVDCKKEDNDESECISVEHVLLVDLYHGDEIKVDGNRKLKIEELKICMSLWVDDALPENQRSLVLTH